MRCFAWKKSHSFLCKIVLLDEQELIQEINDSTSGQEVLDTVFRHLNLLETAYFGLRYLDPSNQPHWLDVNKKVAKQLKGSDLFTLYFGVKFYAVDPCKLLEEITRYQFFLQVKQDILQGRLPVTFDLAAELGSYVIQSELGDFDPRRHSHGYASEFQFVSNQTLDLENRIADLHKGLIGQIPAVAELNYLEKVKCLDMYGVDLHPVLGEDNVEYFLGLTPSGIIVLRNKTKVGNYLWPRITKVYFKVRYFMLRVCDKNSEETTYGFETPSKQACKHLWKCCVEHHAFFRLLQVTPASSDNLFSSRFRYSGRTEKQAQIDAQMRIRSPPQFSRTPSRRLQRRIVEGAQDSPKYMDENLKQEMMLLNTKIISIPQPVCAPEMHSTSMPAGGDSPRSTRSAPWVKPRGLYTGSASPRSVRSAGHRPIFQNYHRRSDSVESQTSADREVKRHRRRSKRGSDNESEHSSRSHRHHRHKRESDVENDGHRHSRRRSSSRQRHGSNYELVDSEEMWRKVQRKQDEGRVQIHQATVIRDLGNNRLSTHSNAIDTTSEPAYNLHKRKHRKHSRSRSPSGRNPTLPEEIKRQLEFDLVDTEGIPEDRLREIDYKVVETKAKPVKAKIASAAKHRHRSPRSVNGMSKEQPPDNGDSPPPPYSPPQNAKSNGSEEHLKSGLSFSLACDSTINNNSAPSAEFDLSRGMQTYDNSYQSPYANSTSNYNGPSSLSLPNGNLKLGARPNYSLDSNFNPTGDLSGSYRLDDNARYSQSPMSLKPAGGAQQPTSQHSRLNMLRTRAANSPSFLPSPVGPYLPHVSLFEKNQYAKPARSPESVRSTRSTPASVWMRPKQHVREPTYAKAVDPKLRSDNRSPSLDRCARNRSSSLELVLSPLIQSTKDNYSNHQFDSQPSNRHLKETGPDLPSRPTEGPHSISTQPTPKRIKPDLMHEMSTEL
ncbi:band 4.1-like protein 4 isoform X3 [Neocloeon triangulifer]|uniref:band 4.1-like protein 4 isoform X3 n=1 Tax=Neocloeon triangulifer TaxID=2078957 RepID=UPI00286EC466|nr:band 4.1-like protein 4 isoform X3 [Neocloeon triangulifer]